MNPPVRSTRAIILPAAVLLLGLSQCEAAFAGSDPAANRRASATYDAVVHDNPRFKADRAHTECDPIESLDLRMQCFDSFNAAPATIGAAPPRLDSSDPLHPVVTESSRPVQNIDD
jgi:hypothetical protein